MNHNIYDQYKKNRSVLQDWMDQKMMDWMNHQEKSLEKLKAFTTSHVQTQQKMWEAFQGKNFMKPHHFMEKSKEFWSKFSEKN
jgi:predicted NodU family carbamoyl transferase